MKRFNLFNQEFMIAWEGESAGYISTSVLSDGQWEGVENANPTLLTFGKNKMEILELIKNALIEIFNCLKELYGDPIDVVDPNEPESIDDFITWILDAKTTYTKNGFLVNY